MYKKQKGWEKNLENGLGELYPTVQQVVELVPLLLQVPQVLLQLGLGLFVPHGEELPTNLQRVEEAALIPLEQQLRVLRSMMGLKEEKKNISSGNTGCCFHPVINAF